MTKVAALYWKVKRNDLGWEACFSFEAKMERTRGDKGRKEIDLLFLIPYLLVTLARHAQNASHIHLCLSSHHLAPSLLIRINLVPLYWSLDKKGERVTFAWTHFLFVCRILPYVLAIQHSMCIYGKAFLRIICTSFISFRPIWWPFPHCTYGAVLAINIAKTFIPHFRHSHHLIFPNPSSVERHGLTIL